MRRCNSSTHIPISKAKSTSRSSSVSREIPSAPNRHSRAGSTDRVGLFPLKRSRSTLSSSTSINKKTLSTPLQSTGSALKSLTPSMYMTPSTSYSRSKSPVSARNERPVSDKRWIAEQYSKIRRFVEEHPQAQEQVSSDHLKPLSINTFVYLIDILLKEIEPRIIVTMSNYKDLVPDRLKMLKFPGVISGSLMKTVNTMHAWPQIISILSWIIDLVKTIKLETFNKWEDDIEYRKFDCIISYLTHRYALFNNGEREETADIQFCDNMGNILNIDNEKIEMLTKEVNDLEIKKAHQEAQLLKQNNLNKEMKKEMTQLEYEIDSFYSEAEQKEKDFEDFYNQIFERKSRLEETVRQKKENIAKLMEALENQPCTVEEKNKLLMEIDELKHTNYLKKQNAIAMNELKSNWVSKMSEARKNLQVEIYRINRELMKLAVYDPKINELKLKSTNFVNVDDIKIEISTLIQNKEMYEKKLHEEIELMKSTINQYDTENNDLLRKKHCVKDEIATLGTQKENLIQCLIKDNETTQFKELEVKKEITLTTEKINELIKNEPDIKTVLIELNELKQLKIKLQDKLNEKIQETVNFFVKLYDEQMNHLIGVNEIRTKIVDVFDQSINEIHGQQAKMLEELNMLKNMF